MATSTLSDRPKTIRNVVYLSPEMTAYLQSFPQRKRSQAVEKIFQESQRQQEIHDGYQALLKARELLKGTATTRQVVEWIRKDRRSH